MSNSSSPQDCSTPGFPVLHYLPEFAQTHVHWISYAIQEDYYQDIKKKLCKGMQHSFRQCFRLQMLGKKKLEWADHLSADRRKRLVEPVQDHESLTHSGSQRANHKHMYMLMWLIHQHPWLSHVNFGPKPMQYCKAIILPLHINK